MHDIRAIRETPEAFDEGLRRRGLTPRAESLIVLDEKRRAAILALQSAQERRNAVSKQIGVAMSGSPGRWIGSRLVPGVRSYGICRRAPTQPSWASCAFGCAIMGLV